MRPLKIGIIVVAASLVTGCVLDRHRNDRPARLQLGAAGRSIAAPDSGSAPAGATQRTASETMTTGSQQAVVGSAQFTMEYNHLYLGGELETGAARNSTVAGAYAIGGFVHQGRLGSISAELASGWRTVQLSTMETSKDSLVLEPRVRGELRLGQQFALGAVGGATLGDRTWMAGIYLGVHSHPF